MKSVPEIMAFGDGAGFPKTKAYSKYSPVDREVLYYSLSGSKKEEAALKKIGYDTLIGKSRTMSTLGVLPDPIITPMIDKNDPTELVYVIFHERTHQLFFRKNEVTFNENAAVLLGTLTSLEFFKKKFGPQSAEYRAQMEKLDDIIIFSKAYRLVQSKDKTGTEDTF